MENNSIQILIKLKFLAISQQMKSLRTLALAGTVLATLIPHGTAEANAGSCSNGQDDS